MVQSAAKKLLSLAYLSFDLHGIRGTGGSSRLIIFLVPLRGTEPKSVRPSFVAFRSDI